jgi:hypothetical protein
LAFASRRDAAQTLVAGGIADGAVSAGYSGSRPTRLLATSARTCIVGAGSASASPDLLRTCKCCSPNPPPRLNAVLLDARRSQPQKYIVPTYTPPNPDAPDSPKHTISAHRRRPPPRRSAPRQQLPTHISSRRGLRGSDPARGISSGPAAPRATSHPYFLTSMPERLRPRPRHQIGAGGAARNSPPIFPHFYA